MSDTWVGPVFPVGEVSENLFWVRNLESVEATYVVSTDAGNIASTYGASTVDVLAGPAWS